MHGCAGRAYKAGMGTVSGSELDAWLSAGGMVVTSSDRAARAVLRAYNRARRKEGRTAWTAPNVLPWHAFVLTAREERARDSRLVMNSAQEQMLWEDIVGASGQPARCWKDREAGWPRWPRKRMRASAPSHPNT